MSYSTIDIGGGDHTLDNGMNSGYTFMDDNNRANAAGVLTSFQFRVRTSTVAGLKMGTFPLGTKVVRDYESISGSYKVGLYTVTGKNCEVASDDVLGAYYTGGQLQLTGGGATTTEYYYLGDGFDGGSHSYTAHTYRCAFYATGVTVPDAPTSVAATDDLSDKITITWTPGTGETDGHRVYRDGADVSGVVAHGTATYDDVPSAGTYSYTVKAINAAGLSAASTANDGTRTGGGGATLPLNRGLFTFHG
jgi:hypothetical protein